MTQKTTEKNANSPKSARSHATLEKMTTHHHKQVDSTANATSMGVVALLNSFR